MKKHAINVYALASQNKNVYVFAHCNLLVKKKIFKVVRIFFLPVGHTHEDVDRWFGALSRELNRSHALTIEEFEVSGSPFFNKTKKKMK